MFFTLQPKKTFNAYLPRPKYTISACYEYFEFYTRNNYNHIMHYGKAFLVFMVIFCSGSAARSASGRRTWRTTRRPTRGTPGTPAPSVGRCSSGARRWSGTWRSTQSRGSRAGRRGARRASWPKPSCTSTTDSTTPSPKESHPTCALAVKHFKNTLCACYVSDACACWVYYFSSNFLKTVKLQPKPV